MEVEETTLKLIAEMMRSFSQILKAETEIEEAGGQPFDEALKKLFSPEKLAEMRNTLPPDLYARRISLQAHRSSAKTTKPPSTHHRREEDFKRNIRNSRVKAMTIQLPPPTALPAPQPPYQLR